MRCAIDRLSFELADDICTAFEAHMLDKGSLPSIRAKELGPLLELAQTAPALIRSGPIDAGHYSDLLRRLTTASTWHSPTGREGVVRTATLQFDPLSQPLAMMKMKAAATEAGFSGDLAAQLVGAVGELVDNVLNHSENIASGYLAYHAEPSRFEFFVGDLGIGVLKSLRTNPSLANLDDAGRALELALTEGVSRYADPGHGMGFRPIFVGLANRSRLIRFRSGDYGRMLVRDSAGNISARTVQSANIRGFCCSVLCDLQ